MHKINNYGESEKMKLQIKRQGEFPKKNEKLRKN